MNSIKRAGVALCVAGLVLSFASRTLAEEMSRDPLKELQLTEEQKTKLTDLTEDFIQTDDRLDDEMAAALLGLASDLQREDRFETKQKAEESAKTFNTLVKKISSAYGEQFRNRVRYVLEAKDVLTPEQRATVFAGLNRDLIVPKVLVFYDDFDDLRKALGLDVDQSRKVLRIRTAMWAKDLEIQLAIDTAALDLEEELAKEKPDAAKVNEQVMQVADQIVKMLDNRVEHFLKAKDVLTVEQKKEVLRMLKEE